MKLMMLPIKPRNIACVIYGRLVSLELEGGKGMAKREFHDGEKYRYGTLCTIQ